VGGARLLPSRVAGRLALPGRAQMRIVFVAPFTEGRKLWGKGMRSEERVRERSEGKELGA
jgi:hypothetical protein